MPSLANSKQQTENKPNDLAPETPVNSIITIIEHKIRNLEKRKVSHGCFFSDIFVSHKFQISKHMVGL